MIVQDDWLWLDTQTGFRKKDLVAAEYHPEAESPYGIFTFEEESALWWTGTWPQQALSSLPLTPLTPHLSIRLSSLAAFRKRYAGTSKGGHEDWLLYLGHNQLVELNGPSRDEALQALDRLLQDDPFWVHAPSGPVFHLKKLVATVYEQPRAEIFEPRLGIYLREGHELNLYDRADVREIQERLRTYTDAQNHFLRLWNDTCFDLKHVASCKALSSGNLQITLAHGPGITLTDAHDIQTTQEALKGLSGCL